LDDAWVDADTIPMDYTRLSPRLDPCLHAWFCKKCDTRLFTAEVGVLSAERTPPEDWLNDYRHQGRSMSPLQASIGSHSWTVRHYIDVNWSYPDGTGYGPFAWFDVHRLGPFPMVDDVVIPGLGVACCHPASGQSTWCAAREAVEEFAPIVLSEEWSRAIQTHCG